MFGYPRQCHTQKKTQISNFCKVANIIHRRVQMTQSILGSTRKIISSYYCLEQFSRWQVFPDFAEIHLDLSNMFVFAHHIHIKHKGPQIQYQSVLP